MTTKTKFEGCYTALITPFTPEGKVDWEGLERLIEFQISQPQQRVSGILACGTTGESPTLSWNEHMDVILQLKNQALGRCQVIAGVGSNSTAEALKAAETVVKCGSGRIDALLLMDPYYNGPSSREIRLEYYAPIARAFPETAIIPYIIPGRTGTQLLPEDLAILYEQYPNVSAVKDATGDADAARRIRQLCGEDFNILSGDDDKTWGLMWRNLTNASGVISVISNVAPRAVQEMTEKILAKDFDSARVLKTALQPLFDIVTVKTEEQTPYGPVLCRARNPLAIKTLMNILGMPSGPCRPPLGKMTEMGLSTVLRAAQNVYDRDTEIFTPIEEFFGVNIEERLTSIKYREGLFDDSY